jgi:hypothetical protein
MATKLNFGRDNQGYNAFSPSFPDNTYSASLTMATASSITVPGDSQNWIAVLSYQPGAIVWVRVNGTAAMPAGTTFAASTSILLPAQLHVNAGDTISCYNNSSDTQDVGISLYAVTT